MIYMRFADQPYLAGHLHQPRGNADEELQLFVAVLGYGFDRGHPFIQRYLLDSFTVGGVCLPVDTISWESKLFHFIIQESSSVSYQTCLLTTKKIDKFFVILRTKSKQFRDFHKIRTDPDP